MALKIAGFPGIASLNKKRAALFAESHDAEASYSAQITSWFGHKALCVLSLPVNIASTFAGSAAATLTACTLGAAKIVTYAATLGHIQPSFSIGFNWLAERTISSLAEAVFTVGELIYDAFDLCYQAYKGAKWVLEALRLNFLIHYIKDGLLFVRKRIDEGCAKTAEDEKCLPAASLNDLIPLLSKLNAATSERSAFKGDQPLKKWAEHKLFSLINIPANAAVAAISGICCVAGFVAAVAKSILYAATSIHIPLPTGWTYSGTICFQASANAIDNAVDIAVDVPVLIYKIAERTHLTTALVKVGDLLLYIPRAILT